MQMAAWPSSALCDEVAPIPALPPFPLLNLESAVARTESAQDPGDKAIPPAHRITCSIRLAARHAFLAQALAHLPYAQLPNLG